MARAIPTKAPSKGDLVVGHRVWAFMPKDLPAIAGVIVEASDASVVMEVSAFLSALGLPRRSRWTWRRSVGAYQQAGTKTQPGVGLALDCRSRASVAHHRSAGE